MKAWISTTCSSASPPHSNCSGGTTESCNSAAFAPNSFRAQARSTSRSILALLSSRAHRRNAQEVRGASDLPAQQQGQDGLRSVAAGRSADRKRGDRKRREERHRAARET